VACGTIPAAAEAAYRDAEASGKDAIVLLSPACASFDQFADFEQRGEAFRAAVQRLAAGKTTQGAA
jgi:UDP-N-acetylmuramoylalanine--D-glutamate ligase